MMAEKPSRRCSHISFNQGNAPILLLLDIVLSQLFGGRKICTSIQGPRYYGHELGCEIGKPVDVASFTLGLDDALQRILQLLQRLFALLSILEYLDINQLS